MASSRKETGENRSLVLMAKGLAGFVLCAAAALFALFGALAPSAAWAAEESPTVCVEAVSVRALAIGSPRDVELTNVAGGANAADAGVVDAAGATGDAGTEAEPTQLPRLAPLVLSAATNPVSIEVGRDCGMDWMCGISPCLCGSADHWGGCSCNGLEEVSPQVSFMSSDEGVVRVVEAFGQTWLVPVGAGTATVTATPALRYHAGQDVTFAVRVDGAQAGDALLAGMVLAVIAIIGGVVFGVRATVRKAKQQGGEQ